MASTDFETEKAAFREFYDSSRMLLEEAKDAFMALIRSLLLDAGTVEISKIEGRVKDREECIQKFNRKYRPTLESSETPYAIRERISDLIGIRVVCLYEDQIRTLHETLGDNQFKVLATTDKIANIENTEASFGYKGLHLDLILSEARAAMPEYRRYAAIPFELQLRTIVQDSWSVLDHKIKYKKSIPNSLKRRINTLAALFELADREFRTIREATDEEIKRAQQHSGSPDDLDEGNEAESAVGTEAVVAEKTTGEGASLPLSARSAPLDAFGFLRIASHFYRDFDFEPRKVDGFTQEIVSSDPNIRRSELNRYLRTTISHVKKYQVDFEADPSNSSKMNPYTVIRHCLWLAEPKKFSSMLTTVARERFEAWLRHHPRPAIV
jgi:putative GTP pyrophosphokinase